MPKSISLLAVVLVLGSPAMTQDNAAVFGLRIVPILEAHCAGCHGGSVAQSGFSIASFDSVLRGGKHGALAPGSAAQSLLMQYVRGEKIPRMPLGSQLPAEIIEQLAEAINGMKPLTDTVRPSNAHWEWLLTRPKASTLPAVKNAGWVRNPAVLQGSEPSSPAVPTGIAAKIEPGIPERPLY